MNVDTVHKRRIDNLCDINGLKQLVKKQTRVTEHSSTMNDLCLTNIHNVKCEVLIEDQISDHHNIEIVIPGVRNCASSRCKTITVWRDYDKEKFWELIGEWLPEWNTVCRESVNEKMNWFMRNVKCSAGNFIVNRTIGARDDFFDGTLDATRIEKNRLYKNAQYSHGESEAARQLKWDEYRKYKNEYKNEIVRRKYDHNQKKFDEANGDMKKMWNAMKSIMNKNCDEIDFVEI